MSKRDKLFAHEMFCYLISILVSTINIVTDIRSIPIVIIGWVLCFMGLGFHFWESKTRPDPPDRWDSHLNNEERKWGDK